MKPLREEDVLPARTFNFVPWLIPAALVLIAVHPSERFGASIVALLLGSVSLRYYFWERAARFVSGVGQAQRMSALGADSQAEVALDLIEGLRPPGYLLAWTRLERAAIAFRRGRLDEASAHHRAILEAPPPTYFAEGHAFGRAMAKASNAVTLALLGDLDAALRDADDVKADVDRGAFDAFGAQTAGASVRIIVAHADLAQGLVLHARNQQEDLVRHLGERGESMLHETTRHVRVLVRALREAARHRRGATPYREQRRAPEDVSNDPVDANEWLGRVAPALPPVPSSSTRGRTPKRGEEPALKFSAVRSRRPWMSRLLGWMWWGVISMFITGAAIAAVRLDLTMERLLLLALGALTILLCVRWSRRRGATRVGRASRALDSGAKYAERRLVELARWATTSVSMGAARILARHSYEQGRFDDAARWSVQARTHAKDARTIEAVLALRAHARAAVLDEKGVQYDLRQIHPGGALGRATSFGVGVIGALARGDVAQAAKLASAFSPDLAVGLEVELAGAAAIAVAAPSEMSAGELAQLRDELGQETRARAFLTSLAPKLVADFDAAG